MLSVLLINFTGDLVVDFKDRKFPIPSIYSPSIPATICTKIFTLTLVKFEINFLPKLSFKFVFLSC